MKIELARKQIRFANILLNRLIFYLARKCKARCEEKKRLLLIRADSIGDFILFAPCLSRYREIFPKYEISLLVSKEVENLAELCPYIDRLWSIDSKKLRNSIFERIRLQRKISSYGFDVVINTLYSSNFEFAEAATGWSKATRRVAFENMNCGKKRRRGFERYFTEFVPSSSVDLFEMDRNNRMLQYFGYSGEAEKLGEIWINTADKEAVSLLMSSNYNTQYAVCFPCSKMKEKIWDPDNFIAAIRSFSQMHPMTWVICGSGDDTELCDYIVSGLHDLSITSLSTAGKATLRETAAIIKGSNLYLGNDSMGVHMAAAMKVPSVCILGGGHYGRFYPYPDNPLTVAVSNRLECFNCDWKCTQEPVSCIAGISVEQVVTAMDNLLSEHQDGA